MQCDIYRPKARYDIYIFVPSGANPNLSLSDLVTQFGELQFIKSREIIEGQNIIGANSASILNNIDTTGFHIQGTKVTSQISEGGAAIGGGILGASVAGPFGAIIGAIVGFALAEHAKKVPDDL